MDGVTEIVEIYQDEPAIHRYRREAEGTRSFDAIGGTAAILSLRSADLSIPLAEIYQFAMPPDAALPDTAPPDTAPEDTAQDERR